jgi:hypothetical protein
MQTVYRSSPLLVNIIIGMLLALTACGALPPTSSATLACGDVAGFHGAGGAYSPSNHFSDVPFPSDSLSVAAQFGEVGDIQFQDINVCSAHSTAAAIHAFYAMRMATNGWAAVTKFPAPSGDYSPFQADPRVMCDAGALCWSKGTAPTRYVELATSSHEGPKGSAVTYHLRLLVPPLFTYATMMGGEGDHQISLEGDGTNDLHFTPTMNPGGTVAWLNGAAAVHIGDDEYNMLSLTTNAQLPLTGYSAATIPTNLGAIYAYKTHDGYYGKLTFSTAPDGGLYIFATTYPFSLALAAPAADTCRSLSDFSSAGAATTGLPTFTDVPFVGGSLSYIGPHDTFGTTTYQLIDVCSDGTTPNAVRSAYVTMMAGNGWVVSMTSADPYPGTTHCPGDVYCWKKGAAPTRYVGLDFINDEGAMGPQVTTYTLGLFSVM